VLALGDIIGEPGRKAIENSLNKIKKQYEIDFVIVNGENASGGLGLTIENAKEILALDIDCITTGNHIWRYKNVHKFLETEERILRPANYPDDVYGKGFAIYKKKSLKIGVVNILGRVFIDPSDCPFRKVVQIIENIKRDTKIVIVDFHAEATSEKIAMGYLLDGKVSLVFGTHTHVQTADEQILENGTAYISDLGMVGPKNSVIGMDIRKVIERFVTNMPVKFDVAKAGQVLVEGIVVCIEKETGKAISIKRIRELI